MKHGGKARNSANKPTTGRNPGVSSRRDPRPEGTDLRFNYKIVGGCVPGLRSTDAGSGNGNELTSGSTNGTCRGADCPRIDSWEGQSVTGGDIVGTEVIDSRRNQISQDFNGSCLATQATDANGQPVTYTRDAQNRITRTSDALGRTTVFGYDERGNRNAIMGERGP
ncbi:MAG: RHS repeat protein [Rhodocyclaceae bacterium]|nr:RHS repeat protein [Rhodocyclaceae bacterium]